MMATNKDGFSADCAVLRLDIELASFTNLLALSLLLRVVETKFFNLTPYKRNSFSGIFQGCFETSIFCLDFDNHFKVIGVHFNLMFNKE